MNKKPSALNLQVSGKVGQVHHVSRSEQKLAKQNTRTLMQAFFGCRKNCQECKEDEKDWEEEVVRG